MHDNVFNLAVLYIIEHSEITFVHKTFFDIYQLFISRVFRLKKNLKTILHVLNMGMTCNHPFSLQHGLNYIQTNDPSDLSLLKLHILKK